MAMRSTYVTAPGTSQVNGYIPTIPNTVDTNIIHVDNKANTYYNEMLRSYQNMQKYFNDLAQEFTNAQKNVTGTTLKKRLQKIAGDCRNQGNYCKNKRQQLIEYFEFAKMESRINDLETALAKISSSDSTTGGI